MVTRTAVLGVVMMASTGCVPHESPLSDPCAARQQCQDGTSCSACEYCPGVVSCPPGACCRLSFDGDAALVPVK
jgi:hypothetical protein